MATARSTIKSVDALEVLDSRGRPTVEVVVRTEGGASGRALVPSGASTGAYEALELRDGGARYFQKGVQRAVAHVEGPLAAVACGRDVVDLTGLDEAMKAADGTPALSALGANAVLGVSLAAAHAGAAAQALPLYSHVARIFGEDSLRMPVPMFNVLNGGAHADNGLDVQEFMVAPVGASSFAEALRAGAEIYHALRSLLKERGLSTSVGDEGGFAPRMANNTEALEAVAEAISRAGYEPGTDIQLALDIAATEFVCEGGYAYEGETRDSAAMAARYASWAQAHPIYSIEDGLGEDDWSGWQHMTATLGEGMQLVGDDLFVTNPARLAEGVASKSANAILIKPNQIGTLTDTFACVRAAYDAGFAAVMSHRSGETEDATIADLAVALGTGQIKTGAPCRGERTAKYNRLLRIESELRAAGHDVPYGLRASGS